MKEGPVKREVVCAGFEAVSADATEPAQTGLVWTGLKSAVSVLDVHNYVHNPPKKDQGILKLKIERCQMVRSYNHIYRIWLRVREA